MKRSVIILLLSLFITTSASYAQVLNFGLRGAFNMSKFISNRSDSTYNFIPSADAGIFGDIKILEGIYLRPEVNYSMKGTKYGKNDIKVTLHYLEVPVSLLYKYELNQGFVVVGAGMYWGMLIGGKHNGNDITMTDNVQDKGGQEFVPHNYIRKMDFGGKFYAGYEFDSGLGLGLQSNVGFKELAPSYEKIDPLNTHDLGSYKNFNIGIYITYKLNTFDFKKRKYDCGCPN